MQKLSTILIHLLKGVIYRDQQPQIFSELLTLLNETQAYFATIGLEVYIDELEGFAFLKQKELEDEEAIHLKLIQKRPLSYPVSLLCLLLRKQLLEQDVQGGLVRPIITQEQVITLMTVYLPERHNEAKLVDQVETAINKVIELGFLRPLKQQEKTYEIQRIIKAFIDADWLDQLQQKLDGYYEYAKLAD